MAMFNRGKLYEADNKTFCSKERRYLLALNIWNYKARTQNSLRIRNNSHLLNFV